MLYPSVREYSTFFKYFKDTSVYVSFNMNVYCSARGFVAHSPHPLLANNFSCCSHTDKHSLLPKYPFPFVPLPPPALSSLYHCLYRFLSLFLAISASISTTLSYSRHSLSLQMAFSLPFCNVPALLSPSPIFGESALPPEVEKREDVVENPISDSTAECERVFAINESVRTEYRADVPHIDQPAHTARLTDSSQVENIRAMVRNGTWVSTFTAFSVAEKNPLAERHLQPPTLVNGKLTVPP